MKKTTVFFLMITSLFLFCVAADAKLYEVGAGKAYTTIGAVPWESLSAGDTVLIYYKATPYNEKFNITAAGTVSKPVVIRGVPNISGNLPVIDGQGATTRAQLNFWNGNRSIIKIGGTNTPSGVVPSYIVIENLDVQNALSTMTFTSSRSGETSPTNYATNAAAIHVEEGNNITIRNCAMHNCGNGFFTSPDAYSILVERCYIYDNGNTGSIYEHNSYTEAHGIIFQFNHYGPLRTGCLGNNLKDRSSGCIIRYNWIESGNRQLDLVDAEDDATIVAESTYAKTFVYGNILIEPDGAGNSQIVHYGGDSGNEADYRKGTLYFYNNTIVSTRTNKICLFRLSSDSETADCRNNIMYCPTGGLSMIDQTGTVHIKNNYLKTGWVETYSGTTVNVINDGGNISGTSPGFKDANNQDFTLINGAACANSATALATACLPDNAIAFQYTKHQNGVARTNALDLGAFQITNVITYLLTVTNGTGSGSYISGTVVNISANAPTTGKIFDKWTGTTTGIANINSASTTITMPSSNVTVTATYKNSADINDNCVSETGFFPNPATDIIYINQPGTVNIYDMNGILQIQKQIKNSKEQFDVSILPAGIYIIKIKNEESTTFGKIIKE